MNKFYIRFLKMGQNSEHCKLESTINVVFNQKNYVETTLLPQIAGHDINVFINCTTTKSVVEVFLKIKKIYWN